ncbi:hypothetical protein D9611_008101 [Ephemerocybe angulata]|uniref:Integrase core domain-containing protein n=1 Tax=Ephemerocybe angulata TaxID=980116 RepID=A0A8H5FD55_9AGAR|nr:hypothetical protein D9611_008101 [Tulosesus angulatus]
MAARTNNNMAGVNGYGTKAYPPDDVLREALHQYSKERLSTPERLARLKAEFNLEIKDRKLYSLNKQFDVPSVRKPPPEDIATQLVLDKVAEDIAQSNGTGTILSMLANEGFLLPRDFVRNVLAQYAPEGLARRFPGANRIQRSSLSCLGPNHQHHGDGHEKMNAQALQMGGVALNIYGIKDQWSSYLLNLVVVPNDRDVDTVGHVFLDTIQKRMTVPITMVTDKGTEIGYMFAYQTGMRSAYAPTIDSTHYPPFLQLKSVHNTPIEGLWHWFLKTFGVNLKVVVVSGYENGNYNPNNPVHPKLFYWLWPQIMQIVLDRFVEYWNNHKIRKQAKKPNMSGSTPRHAFTVPALPAFDCGIEVDQAVIDALRNEIKKPREEVMMWPGVDAEFSRRAEHAYDMIGRPELIALKGWEIFSAMLHHIPAEPRIYI